MKRMLRLRWLIVLQRIKGAGVNQSGAVQHEFQGTSFIWGTEHSLSHYISQFTQILQLDAVPGRSDWPPVSSQTQFKGPVHL